MSRSGDAVKVVIRFRGGLITRPSDSATTEQIIATKPNLPLGNQKNPFSADQKKNSNNKNSTSSEKEEEQGEEQSDNEYQNLFREVVIDRVIGLKHSASPLLLNSSSSSSSSPTDDKNTRYTFDTVFSPQSSQESVYEEIGQKTVSATLEGYNACILAYGMTGSSKTYTMVGDPTLSPHDQLTSDKRGLVPRCLTSIFDHLENLPKVEMSFQVELSVYELYNENLFDLLVGSNTNTSENNNNTNENNSSSNNNSILAPENPFSSSQQQQQQLRIREDRGITGRGVFIENMLRKEVTSAPQALKLIEEASKKKHVGETLMNTTSSRSHTIFDLFISQVKHHADGDSKISSQFFCVDLAGSEKVSRTGAVGERLEEAKKINLSLTLLGRCINKLTESSSSSSSGGIHHVPFRDSKLTRLLQNSLGGNSVTTLLCTISGLAVDTAETLSTLQFASRAKSIKNVPKANLELSGDALKIAYAKALEQIATLKEKNKLLEAQVQILSLNPNFSSSTSSSPKEIPPPEKQTKTPLKKSSSSSNIKPPTTSSSTSSSSFRRRLSNATSAASASASFDAEQQQQQKSNDNSAMFENSILSDLQNTVASLITELNNEKEERQFLANEKHDLSERINFHLSREKELDTKILNVESQLLESKEENEKLKKEMEQQQEEFNGINNSNNNNNSALRKRIQESVAEAQQIAVSSPLAQMAFDERLQEEVEKLKRKQWSEIAEIEKTMQRANESLENELVRLQGKLDIRTAEVSTLKNENFTWQEKSETLKEELERAHKAVADMMRNDDNNAIVLHQENKKNGERIKQLVADNEKKEKLIRDLQREINELMKEIEALPIAADQKAKLLSRRLLQDQRSLFKKKLLACFSVE